VAIFAVFDTTPKRVVHHKKKIDVLYQKYFNLMYHEYSSTPKKNAKSKEL